ncbi:hypothetical protein C8F01DRAFT_512176 [Mycena amicta]|nr:hypothetical protein C8F01DRAFT_512176 [Mycena amicta]
MVAAVANGFLVSYGVELASSWINMMLYMLEIVLCFRYFQRRGRPLGHRIGVGAMLVFDTICTGAINGTVFITFLALFGKETQFFVFGASTTLSILMTYSTAAVEQLFLCHLYFVLSRNRIISLLLVFLCLAHLAVSYAGAIMVSTIKFHPVTFQVTAAGAIMCAFSDILIAGFLGSEFYKMQKTRSSMRTVWRRVFFLSLTSGAIVAFTTLLMMILLLKGDIAFEFFFSIQGRIYALTLLFNFLSGPFSGASMGSTANNGSGQALAPGNSNSKYDALYYSHKKSSSAPSLRSNISEESLNKELPALPASPGLEIKTWIARASDPYHLFAQTVANSRPVQFPTTKSSPISTRPILSPLSFTTTVLPPPSVRSPASAYSPETSNGNGRPRTLLFPSHRVDSLPGGANATSIV